MANSTGRPDYTAPFINGGVDKEVLTGNPHVDNLMTVVLALGSELWAARRRNRVLEQMLEKKGIIDRAKIESHVPTQEEAAVEDADRDAFIDRLYSTFKRSV